MAQALLCIAMVHILLKVFFEKKMYINRKSVVRKLLTSPVTIDNQFRESQ